MFTRRHIGTILLLATFVSCSRESPERPQDSESWSPGGPVAPPRDMLAILEGSDHVTLYRVTGEFSAEFNEHKTNPKIAGYPKLAEKPVPPAVRVELAQILAESRNFLRENETWTCLPQPFYVIRGIRGNDTIDVIVHECGDVEIHGMIAGKARDWHHGLRPSSAESRLWSLMRGLIPARANCCG
ncbi:MAG TPA: hypothetical protein VF266_07970 [Thermoanaerobaculia bacterium]